MIKFALAYLVMLVMSYNGERKVGINTLTNMPILGYIILMIMIGTFLGAMVFRWDTVDEAK